MTRTEPGTHNGLCVTRQKVSRSEIWQFRGSGVTSVELITPKVGRDAFRPGFPKSGRFVRLNASPLSCTMYFSLIGKSLYRAKSSFIRLGPEIFGIVLEASP